MKMPQLFMSHNVLFKQMLLSLLCTSLYAQNSAPAPTSPNFDAVVATVNGIEIKKGQLELAYQSNLGFVSDKPVTRERILNELINRELGIKRAKDTKLDQDPVVKTKMEDVLYHAQISKDLEKKLLEIKVSDKEVEEYYAKNKEYRTAQILLRLQIIPQKEEVEEAMKKILEVYNQLKKKPTDWAELAARYSQISASQAAGDIGFQPAYKLAPEYFKAINGKPIGYITSPVQTQFGFHLIKVIGIKEYKDIDMNLYKKILHDIKRDRIIEDYFSDMRKASKVTINKNLLN